jgi:hypothetical protein
MGEVPTQLHPMAVPIQDAAGSEGIDMRLVSCEDPAGRALIKMQGGRTGELPDRHRAFTASGRVATCMKGTIFEKREDSGDWPVSESSVQPVNTGLALFFRLSWNFGRRTPSCKRHHETAILAFKTKPRSDLPIMAQQIDHRTPN